MASPASDQYKTLDEAVRHHVGQLGVKNGCDTILLARALAADTFYRRKLLLFINILQATRPERTSAPRGI